MNDMGDPKIFDLLDETLTQIQDSIAILAMQVDEIRSELDELKSKTTNLEQRR